MDVCTLWSCFFFSFHDQDRQEQEAEDCKQSTQQRITYVSSRSSTNARAVELRKAATTAMGKGGEKKEESVGLFDGPKEASCFQWDLMTRASPAKAAAPANSASVCTADSITAALKGSTEIFEMWGPAAIVQETKKWTYLRKSGKPSLLPSLRLQTASRKYSC